MFYLGTDVSKAKLDCCLLDPQTQKRKNKVVQNSAEGILNLKKWLHTQGMEPKQVHMIMEPTASYHEAAALAWCNADGTVSLVNPAYVRRYAQALGARNKTDTADAAVLARYGAVERPAAWTPPSAAACTLQALLVRREALAEDLQRERNRTEKLDTTDAPEAVRKSLNESIQFLEKQLTAVQTEIRQHIDRHPGLHHKRAQLLSIPGVGEQVAQHMTALLAARRFDTAEQLAAYLGLVPIQWQSGSSIHRKSRLSKAGPAHLRKLLYLPAVTATRCNPHIKALYQRLLNNGKSKMSAIGAAMRKLVHLCFGVIRSGKPYTAGDLKMT